MVKQLILIGFMGAGKTSVGKTLASLLDYSFIDLDNQIEVQQKLSIVDIFNENGEAFFRSLELQQIKQINNLDRVVVSTGGGIIENLESRNFLYEIPTVVWLDISYETVLQRLCHDEIESRPLFNDDVKKRFDSRQDLYRKVANFIIPVDNLSIVEVAETIINRYG